jgi:hypothetical protein
LKNVDHRRRKRPTIVQSSASISRNQDRARPGARPQNTLTGRKSISKSCATTAAVTMRRSRSGSRASIPDTPQPRARCSATTGRDSRTAPIAKRRVGDGSPSFQHAICSATRSVSERCSST